MTFWVLVFIAEMLEVKGTLYFFDTFMEKRDGGYRNRYRFFVYCGVLYLAAVTGIWIGMLKCILIILVMSLLNLAYYEVSFIQHIFPLHLCISCLGNRNLFSRGKCHHISADLCNVPHIYKKT